MNAASFSLILLGVLLNAAAQLLLKAGTIGEQTVVVEAEHSIFPSAAKGRVALR